MTSGIERRFAKTAGVGSETVGFLARLGLKGKGAKTLAMEARKGAVSGVGRQVANVPATRSSSTVSMLEKRFKKDPSAPLLGQRPVAKPPRTVSSTTVASRDPGFNTSWDSYVKAQRAAKSAPAHPSGRLDTI